MRALVTDVRLRNLLGVCPFWNAPEVTDADGRANSSGLWQRISAEPGISGDVVALFLTGSLMWLALAGGRFVSAEDVAVVVALVGIVGVWLSANLRVGEKVLASLVIPGAPLLWLRIWYSDLRPGQQCFSSESSDSQGHVLSSVSSCTHTGLPGWIGSPVLIVLAVSPVVIFALLMTRIVKRGRHAASRSTANTA